MQSKALNINSCPFNDICIDYDLQIWHLEMLGYKILQFNWFDSFILVVENITDVENGVCDQRENGEDAEHQVKYAYR